MENGANQCRPTDEPMVVQRQQGWRRGVPRPDRATAEQDTGEATRESGELRDLPAWAGKPRECRCRRK